MGTNVDVASIECVGVAVGVGQVIVCGRTFPAVAVGLLANIGSVVDTAATGEPDSGVLLAVDTATVPVKYGGAGEVVDRCPSEAQLPINANATTSPTVFTNK